jgi:hypothetical protein
MRTRVMWAIRFGAASGRHLSLYSYNANSRLLHLQGRLRAGKHSSLAMWFARSLLKYSLSNAHRKGHGYCVTCSPQARICALCRQPNPHNENIRLYLTFMDDLGSEERAINDIADKLATVDVNTPANAITGIVDSLRRDAENRVVNSSPTVASIHAPDSYFALISAAGQRDWMCHPRT